MSQREKSKEDFIVMAEAGFIAINQADEDAAVKLFKAAQLLKPENSLPKIGRGYMHFLKLELKQACKVFQEVLDKEPSNEMAKALLGLSLAITPDATNKGENILEQVTKSSDSTVQAMAKTAIEFVEKHVKKSPPPAAGSPKKN